MMQFRIDIKKNSWDKTTHEYKEDDFYSCWGEVLDLIGAELYNAINVKLENTVIFKVRYCKKLEELRNKNDFIVYFQNHKYEIYQPDFMGYNKQYIKIKCKEII